MWGVGGAILTLRNDFAKDDNADSGADDGDKPCGESVKEDCERGVDQHVPQKERAQQEVAVAPHRLDGPGVATLLWRPRVGDDLQLRLIERH